MSLSLSRGGKTCRPRFSFFCMKFSKNRHMRRRNVVGWVALSLMPGRVSLTRLSSDLSIKPLAQLSLTSQGRTQMRQRRAALVRCPAYTGGLAGLSTRILKNCPKIFHLIKPAAHHAAPLHIWCAHAAGATNLPGLNVSRKRETGCAAAV